jgi:carbamoyltransferase
VTAQSSPLLHRLLQEMKATRELPILINTSFNVDGEPIVETPEDAMKAFLGSTLLRSMTIDDYFLEKTP